MNQILDYNPQGVGNGNGKRGKNNSDKIITITAIILVIFAIFLIGMGIYNKIKNSDVEPIAGENKKEANISIEKSEDKVLINVTHDKVLQKLIYSWNDGNERNMAIDTGKTFETSIDLPAGNNKLTIQVVDEDGNITSFSEDIESETGKDIVKPTITLEKVSEGKLKITAVDETALDYVTYRWDDEEDVRKDAEGNNDKEISFEIDIREGEGFLSVSAVDKSSNQANKKEQYKGLLQPEVKVVLAETKDKLVITCTHESGITEISYTLNDKPYKAQLDEPLKEVTFEQKLEVGENVIILDVKSSIGTTTTFGGKCTYAPNDTSAVE